MNRPSSMSSSGLHFTHPYLAVVLGGGFTGMLAAAALSGHADVIIVERESVPRTSPSRGELPQPRHAHLLTSGAAAAIEELLPGITGRWLAAGARRIPLPTTLAGLSTSGRARRRSAPEDVLACSRDLLDRVLRAQVLALPGVTVLSETEAETLTGTAADVTGVRVRDSLTGATQRLDADLVVDATGRTSRTPERLVALGLPCVREEVVDAGAVCATRIFRAPDGAGSHPLITACSGLEGQAPGRSAMLVPIEDNRWLVTLSGILDGRPSQRADRFVPFARALRQSAIGDLIAGAEPLSEVRLTRDTANRRRRYEQLESWPTGFVVLGDAATALNPVYGQGLSAAARAAAALRGALRRHGLDDPGLARGVQRSVGRLVQGPWAQTTGQDIRYPGAIGPRPSAVRRFAQGSVNRVLRTATARPLPRHGHADLLSSPGHGHPLHPKGVRGLLPTAAPRPLITPPPTTSRPSTSLPGSSAAPGAQAAPGTQSLPETQRPSEPAAPPEAPTEPAHPEAPTRSEEAGPDTAPPRRSSASERWPCQGRRPWPSH